MIQTHLKELNCEEVVLLSQLKQIQTTVINISNLVEFTAKIT